MKVIEAFSPGHITGMFQICDEAVDPLLKGSRGAGVSISRGVTTKVSVKRSWKSSFKIRINREETTSARVSEYVLKSFLSRTKGKYEVNVDHTVSIPIGAGIGSSGAGALSLALALNEALELNLTKVEAAQLAHVAEVDCKTGLGTVTAEFYGGLKIRVTPGAPGIARIMRIPNAEGYVVLYISFGPLSTRELLCDESVRRRVNEAGSRLIDDLISSPSPENFMLLSRQFAEKVKLMSDKLTKTLSAMDEQGYTFSMAMLGETAFSLIKKSEFEALSKTLRRITPTGMNFYVADIDFRGARVV